MTNKKKNITEVLEDLGWLIRPTAKTQFINTPSLLFKYKDYDNYSEAIYLFQKQKWAGRVSSGTFKEIKISSNNKEVKGSDSNNKLIELNDETAKLTESNKIIVNETIISEKPQELTSNNIDESKVIKLNNKRNKINKNNTRDYNLSCPYCLSKLVTNNLGILECTGEKLELWVTEFLRYDKFDLEQRKVYLKLYSNPGMFLDLFERWSWKDETGRRQNFICIYSNRITNPISKFRTQLYDPIVVNAIERSLGRKLTDEELRGDKELWRQGSVYFEDYKANRVKVKIPLLTYPDAFI